MHTEVLIFHIISAHGRTGEFDFKQMDILDMAIEKVLTQLKGGYVETYYWDCDWPGIPLEMRQPINFEICSQDPFHPVLGVLKPPET